MTDKEQPGSALKPYTLHRFGKAKLYFATFRAAVETMKNEPSRTTAISYTKPGEQDCGFTVS